MHRHLDALFDLFDLRDPQAGDLQELRFEPEVPGQQHNLARLVYPGRQVHAGHEMLPRRPIRSQGDRLWHLGLQEGLQLQQRRQGCHHLLATGLRGLHRQLDHLLDQLDLPLLDGPDHLQKVQQFNVLQGQQHGIDREL
jgi:hypothetical protein